MSTIVTLKKNEGRTVKRGGLWIYDNEISTITGRFHNGDIVSVVDDRGHFIGQGYINQNSKIRIRLLSRHENDVLDDAFFTHLLQRAWDYRKKVVDTNSCRVVFGEADGLPGLVIDKFEDVLVIQSLTLGMDRLKDQIVRLMKDILEKDGIVVRGIYERSDAKERTKEGLERIKGFLSEPFDTKFIIEENGVRYEIDVENGQKTGYFLDQKYNRLAIQSLCQDADVLDCFTYIGSFALNAAKGGAQLVLGVDASDLAVELASRNAVLNGVEDHVSFEAHDLFDFLPELVSEGRSFDVVILDPPAFTKSRSSIKNAMKGYREINMRGMRLIKDGGYLATCTCSHFMDDGHFRQAIEQAARLAHKRLRQIEFRQQSPDHPIVWGMGESSYLKFYIFQVFDY